MRVCRVLGFRLFQSILLALGDSVKAQTAVAFPWGASSGKHHQPAPYTGTPPVYRTLSKLEGHHVTPQPNVLQSYPQQQAYAYGWFGSNPTPIWGRHFGTGKNYTQWTQR